MRMSNIHVCFSAVVCLSLAVSAANYQRTIVAIAKPTEHGQYIFLRGGGPNGKAIPIFHNLTTRSTDSVYAVTVQGDVTLTWKGKEAGQRTYRDDRIRDIAKGTPLMWTTNDPKNLAKIEEDGYGYTPLNYQGESLWMVDFYMDCDKTNGGWFDFKGYMVDFRQGHSDPRWEKPFTQTSCLVNGEETSTSGSGWDGRNHHGVCGSFNFVFWSDTKCFVDAMDQYLLPLEHAHELPAESSPTSPDE